MPIFFSSLRFDPAEPTTPFDVKIGREHEPFPSDDLEELEIDSRLNRWPTEKIIYKRSASCFKGTDLHDNLSSLGIDTLIVTGVQASHCVYATCRDAVGDRCELMDEVSLLDIELELADVLSRSQVIEYLEAVA